jgi:citrate synthase
MAMQKELGTNITHEDIRAYLWKTLKSGQVVPGYAFPLYPSRLSFFSAYKSHWASFPYDRYGHGVLRNPDPRFIALQEFCQAKPELKQSPIVDLVNKVRFPSYLPVHIENWHTNASSTSYRPSKSPPTY